MHFDYIKLKAYNFWKKFIIMYVFMYSSPEQLPILSFASLVFRYLKNRTFCQILYTTQKHIY